LAFQKPVIRRGEEIKKIGVSHIQGDSYRVQRRRAKKKRDVFQGEPSEKTITARHTKSKEITSGKNRRQEGRRGGELLARKEKCSGKRRGSNLKGGAGLRADSLRCLGKGRSRGSATRRRNDRKNGGSY